MKSSVNHFTLKDKARYYVVEQEEDRTVLSEFTTILRVDFGYRLAIFMNSFTLPFSGFPALSIDQRQAIVILMSQGVSLMMMMTTLDPMSLPVK